MKTFTNDELMEMLSVADEKIKELEDSKIKDDEKERINYINVIKKFGNKYSDEELEKEDLKTLELIADACSRFGDFSEDKPNVIPIGGKVPKEKTRKGRRVDFSKTFADVDKDFDLGGIKVKQ